MTGKKVKIGCASGFWGDSNMSTPQLVASKELDYLVFDYLAEITMSIMARQRASHPERGYAHDFVSQVMPGVLTAIAEQGIRVVSNGGGVAPESCGRAVEAVIKELGLSLSVAVVTGDDLMDRVEDFRAAGVTELYSGLPMPGEFMSMNAYLGAFPIAEALAKGADIVITGRGMDSAVTLGPCINEFGVVSSASVAEQLVYEIGDPQAYILPDVVCDFSQWELTESKHDVLLTTSPHEIPRTLLFRAMRPPALQPA